MQTFLPFQSFMESAGCLDRQRLGKQRVEAKQILLALTDPAYGWKNHPAVKMWEGHEIALATYGYYICDEWRRRGYKDSLKPFFSEWMAKGIACYPNWYGDAAFHRSHQSNLVRKFPEHYRRYFPDVPADLEYVWPAGVGK
jgi:hypothetical protein